jgi:hypothetical protein
MNSRTYKLISSVLHVAALFFSAFTLSLIASCGGGDGVGSGGTGIIGSSNGLQTGTVSGFGSVIIEGNRYDDSIAVVTTDIEPGNTLASTLPSVRLGMQVKSSFDSLDRITALSILPTIIGKVAAINLSSAGDTLIVAGQTVRVQSSTAALSAPTVYEGITSAKDVAVGDKLEVHGYFDTDGSVIATRVELLDDRNTLTRVSGTVANLSTSGTAQSFNVAALAVRLSSTSKILPTNSVLKNGDRVAIWANVDSQSAVSVTTVQVVDASVVRIETSSTIVAVSSTQPWRIAGPIVSVDTSAKTLKIDDISINFANATLKNTLLADLQKGAVVRVKGSGSNATEVELLKTPEKVKVELAGLVTDFISTASFKVRNALVNASAANIIFNNGSKTNLGDGVLVELEGTIVNGVIVPTQVTLKTAEDSRTQAFIGQVSNYNATTGLFTMQGAQGVQGKLTSSTVFKTFSGGNATLASFANGINAQVKGSFAQGQFIVTEVRLGANVVQEVKIEGVASNVSLLNRSLNLNGVTVNWTIATDISTLVKLKNGAQVVVEGLSNSGNAGAVAATKIQVKDR